MRDGLNQKNYIFWSFWMAVVFLVLFALCVLVAYLNPEFLKQEGVLVESFLQNSDKLIVHFARELGDLGSTMVVILFSTMSSIVLVLLNKRAEFLQLLLTVAGSGFLTGISKFTVQRVRPEAMEESLGFYTTSFPSGHTLSATAMYLCIAFIAANYLSLGKDTRRGQRILVTLALVLGSLVAVARIITLTHYPFDCLAGFLGGVGCASLFAWYFEALKIKD